MEYKYFNKKVGYAVLILLFLYLAIDLFLLDYSSASAYSVAAYLKFTICIFFMAGSRDKSFFFEDEDSIVAAADISVVMLCISLICMNFLLIDYPLSKYIGVILIFGVPSYIHLVSKTLSALEFLAWPKMFIKLSAVALKVSLIVYIGVILVFFTLGEWRWDIKNIADFFNVQML